MASNIIKVTGFGSGRLLLSALKPKANVLVNQVRTKVYTESGALLEKPVRVRFGILKVACTVTPFLLTGGVISREFAALLEETELFVPDDDDDD